MKIFYKIGTRCARSSPLSTCTLPCVFLTNFIKHFFHPPTQVEEKKRRRGELKKRRREEEKKRRREDEKKRRKRNIKHNKKKQMKIL